MLHRQLLPLVVLAAWLAWVPLGAAQLEPGSEPVSLGPLGGAAGSIVVDPQDPDVILLIVPDFPGGLRRSTDAGATFEPFGTGLSPNVTQIALDPTNPAGLFAIDGKRIYKSPDFGATWTLVFTSPFSSSSNEDMKQIALPETGDDVLVIDWFHVWHSPNGGTDWFLAASVVPFGGDFFDAVAYAPDGATAYAGTLHGLQKSSDGGVSFAPAGGSWTTWTPCITVSRSDPDTVFVGTHFGGLFRSTDGGASLQHIDSPVTAGNAYWFAWEPDGRLWYATLTSVVHSPDDGDTWFDATGGWPINTPIPLSVAFSGDGLRYLGCRGGGLNDQSGGGLYRMAAGAPSSWEHIGFLVASINDAAIAGPGGWRVIGIGSGVYAAPQGQTPTPTAWHADLGTETRAVAIDPQDATRWVTGGVGAFQDNAQIAVVTEGGAAFTKTYDKSGAGIVQDIEFDPSNPDKLVAGIYPGGFGIPAIIRSSNGGDSWIEVAGTAGWASRAVAFDPFTPGRVVQLSYDNRWAVSGNSGQTWSALQPPLAGAGEAMLLAFDPFAPGVVYRGETGSGLWRSTNAGVSWAPLGVGLHVDSDLLLHPEFPHLMWVSDDSGHVLVSTDNGDSFAVALDLPLGTNGSALALDTADGSLLVGTTSASTWELPGGCPVVKLGSGTAGTGGFVPRHFLSGGLPQLGSTDFAIGGDRFLGGSLVYVLYGLSEVNVPAFGGSVHVGPGLNLVSFLVGGTPGAGGAGSFDIPAHLPLAPALVGLSVITQCAGLDAGAASGGHVVLSNALRITLHD
jgi:hypothetical protein